MYTSNIKSNKALYWSLLTPALLIPFAASLFYSVVFVGHEYSRIIYGFTKLFLVAWPLTYLLIKNYCGSFKLSIELKNTFRTVIGGSLFGAVIVLSMFILMKTPLGTIILDSSDVIRSKIKTTGVLEHYWLFAIFISLIHSFLEEYYWRWFVFGNLRKVTSTKKAHLLAAVAFASYHIIVLTQFFPIFMGILLGTLVGIGGLIWSLMYQHQKTLLGIWVSHIIIDLGAMAIGHYILFNSYF